jgi:hypothetical protein
LLEPLLNKYFEKFKFINNNKWNKIIFTFN